MQAHGCVELAALHGVEEFGRNRRADVEAQARLGGGQALDGFGHQGIKRGVDRTEPKFGAELVLPGQAHEFAGIAQQAAGFLQDAVAGLGRAHAAPGAAHKGDADFLLQAADLLRHRRRRQVQATCGLGHRSRIDGEQVSAQEGGLHEDSFPFFLLYESAVYLACLPGDTASIVIPQEALPC